MREVERALKQISNFIQPYTTEVFNHKVDQEQIVLLKNLNDNTFVLKLEKETEAIPSFECSLVVGTIFRLLPSVDNADIHVSFNNFAKNKAHLKTKIAILKYDPKSVQELLNFLKNEKKGNTLTLARLAEYWKNKATALLVEDIKKLHGEKNYEQKKDELLKKVPSDIRDDVLSKID